MTESIVTWNEVTGPHIDARKGISVGATALVLERLIAGEYDDRPIIDYEPASVEGDCLTDAQRDRAFFGGEYEVDSALVEELLTEHLPELSEEDRQSLIAYVENLAALKTCRGEARIDFLSLTDLDEFGDWVREQLQLGNKVTARSIADAFTAARGGRPGEYDVYLRDFEWLLATVLIEQQKVPRKGTNQRFIEEAMQ